MSFIHFKRRIAMKKFLIIGFLVLLSIQISYAGEIYIWVDENGIKHFSNTPQSDKINAATEVRKHDEIKYDAEEAAYYEGVRLEQERERQLKEEEARQQRELEEQQRELEERQAQEVADKKAKQDQIDRLERIAEESNRRAEELLAEIQRLKEDSTANTDRLMGAANRARREAREAKEEVQELKQDIGYKYKRNKRRY